jgi:DNA helicase-2/ATP-dependent DNA helicase PcrA
MELRPNPKQVEAIKAPLNKNICVVAGPGSGKTRVIVERMMYLQTEGIAPESIRLVTFTNAAKNEVKSRFKSEDKNRLAESCTTTHGLCREILFETEGNDHYGWQSIGAKKQEKWFVQKLKEKVPSASKHVDLILRTYSNCQHYGLDVRRELLKQKSLYLFVTKTMPVIREYESYKGKNKLIDNTEQLVLAAKALKKKLFAKKCARRVKYLFVDEAQDLCKHKWSIVQSLGKRGSKIFCVGDPAQAIMGFSGAEVEKFIKFEQMFDDARTIKLVNNYRSTLPLVEFSNYLRNQMSSAYNLVESDVSGDMPIIRESEKLGESAAWIARDIKRQIDEGTQPCDITILVHANKDKEVIKQQLKNCGVPVLKCVRHGKKRKKKIRLGVSIETVHKSKGKEWQQVYILDPRLKFHPQMELTELQCWWYVAVSRAVSRLVCCLSKNAGYMYSSSKRKQKHFMDDIPSVLYDFIT